MPGGNSSSTHKRKAKPAEAARTHTTAGATGQSASNRPRRTGRPQHKLKQAVVVVGMHRSGTSAFARWLNLLGAALPDNLLEPEDAAGNPLGFWEPARVVELHDELLDEAARTWFDLEPFPAEWFRSEAAQSYASRLADVVREDYPSAPLIVLKDPRISRLVPLWLEVFKRLEIEPSFVVALRNPLEVAASHRERDEFRRPLSLLLWLRHMLDAERDTRGHPRAVVSYADLLADWRPLVARLGTELGVSWTRVSRVAELEIDDFLRRDARHHVVDDVEFDLREDVSPWVRDAYRLLRQLARKETEEDLCELDAVRQQLDESEVAWGGIVADSIRSLRGARRAGARLTREIAERDEKLEESAVEVARLQESAALQRAEADQLLAAHEAELRQRDEMLAADSERLATQTAEFKRLVAELETRGDELARLTGEVEAREAALAESRERLVERAKLEADLEARQAEQLAEFRAEIADRETSLSRLNAALYQQSMSLTDADAELERTRARVEQLQAGTQSLAERLARKEQELGRRGEELELLRAAQDSTRPELEWLRREALTLQAIVASGRIGTSRTRSASQLLSWLIRGRFGLVREYLHVRRSPDVDGVAYLLRYEDVTRAGLDPLMHYVEHGRAEGRDARPNGSAGTSAETGDPRRRRRSRSPFASWLVHGRFGHVRTYLRLRQSGDFEGDAYLQANPDVAAAGLDPLMHYVGHGMVERRPLRPLPVPVEAPSAPGALAPAPASSAVAGVLERNLPEAASACLVHSDAEDDLDVGPRIGRRFRVGMDTQRLVAELEEARAHGATHVVVTADALRVLEGRREVADYLHRAAHQIMRRDEECALFAFAAAPEPTARERRFGELVSTIVPPSETLVVIGSVDLGDESGRIWRLPAVPEDGLAVRELQALRARGARYLFVGPEELSVLEEHAELGQHVKNGYRTLLRQDDRGALYEAVEQTGTPPTAHD